MDKDGMFPAHPCRKCGKVLNADGYHPAELYGGTYNGLCYSCTNAKEFVADIDDLDGAQVINYPPHAPAWRRDREEYHAYKDCPDCLGKGQKWVNSQGGANGARCAMPFTRCASRNMSAVKSSTERRKISPPSLTLRPSEKPTSGRSRSGRTIWRRPENG